MKSLDDYEVISVIGSGSFGTCFKVQDKITNKIYAWKAINYDELEETTKKEILESEIGFLQQLKHPNIVQYYDNICNIETKTIFIIMEYCDGGDLQNLIEKCLKEKLKFEEKYIWKVLYQISKALQLCHNKISEGCILHRDIKPANIFLDKCGNVKLGDFGLARILKRNHQQQQNFAESFVGSPYYMSPEIVRGRKYNKKSDMWAVGCLTYEMCCLKPPFHGNRFEQLSENITNGCFKSIPDDYSKDLQEIISFMLEVDNEQRPTVEILLRHPVFIRNLNDLKADFPKLLPRNDGNLTINSDTIGAKKLIFSPTTSADLTNFTFSDLPTDAVLDDSNIRITGFNISELRAEIFDSTTKKLFPRTSSFPELNVTTIHNERIYANSIMTSNFKFSDREHDRRNDPELLTRDIFEEALKSRLETIRAHDMLLKQRENNLMEKEKELIEREKRLTVLEKDLEDKKHHVEGMLKRVALEKRSLSNPYPKRRISPTLDESYCSIELNESSVAPTIAKLEMSLMQPQSEIFKSNLKKSVTFVSPKKMFKANNENIPPLQPPSLQNLKLKDITSLKKIKSSNNKRDCGINNFQSSISSKTSLESGNSSGKNVSKRRSILSIFGLNNNSQKNKNDSSSSSSNNEKNFCKNNTKQISSEEQSVISSKINSSGKSNRRQNIEVLEKVNSEEISQIWTKENKKAAFEMLAAMNNAIDNKEMGLKTDCVNLINSQRKSYLRRTTRERGTSLNRSSKLRRSTVYLSPNTSGNRIIL